MSEKILHAFAMSLLLLFATSISAQCPAGETEVTVNLTTDNYGSETSWVLTGPGGSPVYASGDGYASNATSADMACVPDGSICVFTIYDSYGDGICCDFGNGSYSLTTASGTIVSGGNFTTDETTVFQTGTQQMVDVGAFNIDMPGVLSQGNVDVMGSLYNAGSSAISSFTLNYSINGGTPVAQSVTASIAPGATYDFTHATPWNATPGTYTIRVWASDPNGGTDMNTVNDWLEITVGVASQSVQRNALVEEFTSSTCGPCATFNASFDPTLSSVGANSGAGNINAIKYQMNWPNPGNDPSYNNDGLARRTYYGVSGIPDSFIDGADLTAGDATELNNAAAVDAFADMTVTYTNPAGTDFTIDVDITPYADFNGDYTLHIAAVEDFYEYTQGTTSQTEYKFAMRKMLPDGDGTAVTSLPNATTTSFSESYTFVEGGPAPGNSNLWHTIENLSFIAFLQDNATGQVLQSAVASVPGGVGINDISASNSLNIFPNPSTGLVNVQLTTTNPEFVSIEVYNLLGELVLNRSENFASGVNIEEVDLSQLNNGVYVFSVNAGGVVTTERVTINK